MNTPVARHLQTDVRVGANAEVPLVDLIAQHDEVADEVAHGFQRVIHSTGFIGGPAVAAFEQQFAAFQAVDHCIGVANGTDALELVLRAAGIGRGYEVVLPANTFIATAEAVVRAGAVPVLVDSDPQFHLIDVAAAASAVGPHMAALLPVHLYGQMAPMATLCDLAAANGMVLVEDAAQAQGATQRNVHAASFGLAAGTSFYPGKNLGAYGDAGAVLTNDSGLATRVRRPATTAAKPGTSISKLASIPDWMPSKLWCSGPSWPGLSSGTISGDARRVATTSSLATLSASADRAFWPVRARE